MNRHLTHLEINALTIALDFYIKNGPGVTTVADYSGSYPDGPEHKQFPKFNKNDFENIKFALNENGPNNYRQRIFNFGLCCAVYDQYNRLVPYAPNRDDVYDLKATIIAMKGLTESLIEELEQINNKSYG